MSDSKNIPEDRAELAPCCGCGQLTSGACWTDCGMSLCGASLCGDCCRIDEKFGWRHEPRAKGTASMSAVDKAWELLPCPLCGAELDIEGDGYEHPASDDCPLDSLCLEARHAAGWNRREAADMAECAAFSAGYEAGEAGGRADLAAPSAQPVQDHRSFPDAADGFDDDMTRCPCCDGEGYFYHGDEPKSPWGDAATIARLSAAARVSGTIKALELARLFHEAYEELAPLFGYETRVDTRLFDQTSQNGKLMVATCARILAAIQPDPEPKNVAFGEAQTYIDGMTVARIIRDAQMAFRDQYYPSTFALGVGPIQSMLGLAIKNGLIATPSSADTVSVEVAARVLPVTLTTAQLADACMSHRHDYGIVSAGEREDRRREAADWWRCLRKTLAEPSAALRALAGEGGR